MFVFFSIKSFNERMVYIRPFGFIAPETLNYLSFQTFDFERHLMKVILSVPDEGYFERT